jgi:hypothetical protein
VVLVALGVLAAAFFATTCIRGGGRSSFSTPIERLRPDEPVYVSTMGFYLVRLSSGEVVALSEQEARSEDRQSGCVIRYRETLQGAGRTGIFRSDCTGTLYDLTGTPIAGSAPPMKRHPVRRSGDRIIVNLKQCIEGAGGAVVACAA